MLVGTAITGTLDQAGDDAGQRAFHAGDDDDDAGGGEARALAEQPMEAGDADVVQPRRPRCPSSTPTSSRPPIS